MNYHKPQVFVLSNEWIVYVESSMPDLVTELRKDREWAECCDKWQAVKGDPSPSEFAARRKVWNWTRDRHEEIRERTEAKYTDPTYYSFENGSHPMEVHHVQRSIDDSGLGIPEYTNYCFLRRWSSPYVTERAAVNGVAYGGAPSVAIKINQAGYLPKGPKIAYVGAHLYPGALELAAGYFSVYSRHHHGTFPITDKGLDPLSGEHVYELDFSTITESGEYSIHVPEIGVSHPFTIAADVYDKPFAYTLAGLEAQKSTRDYQVGESKFFHPPFKSFGKDVNSDDHVIWGDRFDHIRGSTDMTKTTRVRKGEYFDDAADFDTSADHYNLAFSALYAYEINPHPSLLEAARTVLMVWRRSFDKKTGGVSGFMETDGHRPYGTGDYVFGRRTRWSSLEFSAACALMAMHDTDEKRRASWRWYANKAFNFGADPKNSLGSVTLRGVTRKGEEYTTRWTETEEHIRPYLTHAAIEMYRLTGGEWLKDHINFNISAPYKHPYSMMDSSPWRVWSSVSGGFVRRTDVMEWYLAPADELVELTDANPYGFAWPTDKDKGLGWGESQMTNAARCLLLAYELSGDEKYRTAALKNLSFALGANPLGMCWIAGMGHNSPSVFQQPENAAGIMPYGVTEGTFPGEKNYVQKGKPIAVPPFRNYAAHPTENAGQCEFTIGQNASQLFCMAVLRVGEWAGEVVKNNNKVYLP